MSPVASLVIPAFNRVPPLLQTLESAFAACAYADFPSEILLVDDGSTPPLETVLGTLSPPPGTQLRILRQNNQGSIIARLTGLQAARGEFTLFLDSDDLIPPRKLAHQVAALRRDALDLVYGDMAVASPAKKNATPTYAAGDCFRTVSTPEDFFIVVQPPPHVPMYRTDYLRAALSAPLVSPERAMDPSGDVWLFFNLCTYPARVGKIDEPVAAIGVHEDARYSGHWEKLGRASLLIGEHFMRNCPQTEATRAARIRVGEAFFKSWRALPRDFSPEHCRRVLELWRQAPRGELTALGTRSFARLARLLGPFCAARLLRLRNHRYASCATLTPEAYAGLFPEP